MADFLSHIMAVLYRNMIWAYRSPFRLLDVFLWPFWMLFMLLVFFSAVNADASLFALVLVSVAAWRGLYFVGFETSALFIEEHWGNALQDVLVSPITSLQLAIGGALTGVLKSAVVLVMFLAVGCLAFGVWLPDPAAFLVGWAFLLLAGLSIGFVLFGMACVFEKRNIFTLSFMLPEVIGVASGPYYNVSDVFPGPVAAAINTFPTTHAFNLIKSTFGLAQPDYPMLFATSALWLAAAILLNRAFYQRGRKTGTLVKVG